MVLYSTFSCVKQKTTITIGCYLYFIAGLFYFKIANLNQKEVNKAVGFFLSVFIYLE